MILSSVDNINPYSPYFPDIENNFVNSNVCQTMYLNPDPKITNIQRLEKDGILFPFVEKQDSSFLVVINHKSSNFDQLFGTIYNYLELKEDWDGYGSIKPIREIVMSGQKLIDKIRNESNLLIAPEPMITGNSELGFYWNVGNTYIELDIYEENKYSYFIEEDEEIISFGNEISITGGTIPQDLITILEKNKLVS